MMFPNFFNSQMVDRSGNLTDAWSNMFQDLVTQLQTNFNNEGIKVPQQATANITALNTAASVGNLLYNSDTNQLMVNIAGTYKVVTVT